MIRRLIVLRHAHAQPAAPGQADHLRRLDALGIAEAMQVGAELASGAWIPDAILASDATRARETLALVRGFFEAEIHVETSRGLYGAGWERTSEELALLRDNIATALVVGHNPGLEEVVERAVGQAGIALPTACAALLVGQGASWSQALQPGQWALIGRVVPRI